MDEEPTLPSFSRSNPIARRLDELAGHPPRKRVRENSPPPFSSDPPLFSSDDDPSADNYTNKRQKRKYRGPWFHQQPASDSPSDSSEQNQQVKSKRTLARQFDSGVWLGSDGTEEDFAEGLEHHGVPSFINPRAPIALSYDHVRKLPTSQESSTAAEDRARQQIGECLDEGTEDIILSSLNLSSISNSTISPLASFTCQPKLSAGVTFESLIPNLKIFLQSNRLTSLPASLFSLERLTFLTLRDNQLDELPPSIGNLPNIKELNVSQNKLRYLPFEILQLVSSMGKLKNAQLHPNPFLEPKDLHGQIEQDIPSDLEPVLSPVFGSSQRRQVTRPSTPIHNKEKEHGWSPYWHVAYKRRTQVRFRDITGALMKGPIFPSDSAQDKARLASPSNQDLGGNLVPLADENDCAEPPAPRGNQISRAPSLMEVALSACSKTPQLPYLAEYLDNDSPEHLHALLEQTCAKKDSGGSKCTICKRDFIIARTEWIEFWELAKIENRTASAASPLRQVENERDIVESMVPLIRRGCSWLCVPGAGEAPML
ncbi:hypothetical protein BP6252_05537 [Coleophoma cylindrospora]|uniref:Uncharacterized protein n=1 Tax=Coleophoma cylindrospora TaxID=1849047 RepID=A0A3D8RUE6_9HELO|nr:hypothetical protein BP6252_05537 [Coleophoma cylindrospora]